MRTREWSVCLVLAGLAVACGDQPTAPDRESEPGPGKVALATATSEDGLSIVTDRDDYAPGDTVWFTGAGWTAGDTLDIALTDDPTLDSHQWWVAIRGDGTFRDSTYVVDTEDLGVTFTLTATSRQHPTQTLTVVFTDGNIRIQSNQPGVTFTVTATKYVGSGNCTTGAQTPATATIGSSPTTFTANPASGPNPVESYQFVAAATSDQGSGAPFANWSTTDPVVSNAGNTICVAGFAGSRTYTANYDVAPDLRISKAAAGDFIVGDGGGSYTIVVSNSGTGPAVGGAGLRVTDVLPAGLTFSSGGSADGWQACGASGQTVTCDLANGQSILPGASKSFNLVVNVALEACPSVSNTASVSGGGEPAGNSGNNTSGSVTTTISSGCPNANGAPEVDAGEPYTGAEGSEIPLSPIVSDPDGDQLTYKWTATPTGIDAGGACTFDDDSKKLAKVKCTDDSGSGNFTLTLEVSDGHSHTTSDDADLSVTNVDPTATLNSPSGPVNEGSSFNLSLTGATDASSVDAASLRFAFDCGAGYSATTYAAASTTSSSSCGTAVDGPATLSVRGTVFDDDGGSTEYSGSVTVNNVAPTITSVTPSPSGQLTLGASNQVSTTVTVAFTDPAGQADAPFSTAIDCGNGTDATSAGVCTYTSADVGFRTISATVTDKDGGVSAPKTVQVQIIYNWTGFFQPVDNSALNVAKAGSAVPVKFNLGGNQGLAIFIAGSPNSSKVSCDSNMDMDTIEETVNAGGSTLTYDVVAQQYVYVWKSDKPWTGTCRRLDVKLIDGTTHSAYFRFK